jgi:hypothetical protein
MLPGGDQGYGTLRDGVAITSKLNLDLFWTRDLTPKKYRSHGGYAMGMERYKRFLIDGSAVPTFATVFDWYSQGIILRPGRLSSIVWR